MKELFELYNNENTIYDKNSAINQRLLYAHCNSKSKCWKDFKKSAKKEYNMLPFPYIGIKYFSIKPKILVIGLNLNDCGHWDAPNEFLLTTQYTLLSGWKKIRFGNDSKKYKGTIFYHRVALYSLIILNKFNIIRFTNNDIINNFESLSSAIDYIAFTEAVKCSPYSKNSESKPGKNMISECFDRFLKKEIAILNPNFIISMGKETFYKNDFDCKLLIKSKNISISRLFFNRKKIFLIEVIHPTAPNGGNSNKIPKEFLNIINKCDFA
jgi:hypothetical protein